MLVATPSYRLCSKAARVWRLAGVVGAALVISAMASSTEALAQSESGTNAKFASRTSRSEGGTADPSRPGTIILPFFTPALPSTEMDPATSGGVSMNSPTTTPNNASVITLPAFTGPGPNNNASGAQQFAPTPGPFPKKPKKHGHIPEIDPASMANALTLLVGGVLILTDRRRRPCGV